MENQPIIATASRLGEVKEYYFSIKLKEIARMNAAGKQVINLGIGSPDMLPPKEVLHTIATDCLLYTSPSPRDATLSRMPSSA